LLAAIVSRPAQPARHPGADHAQHAHASRARMSGARLLKRVFDIDIEHCPNCGGAVKIIAAIEDPPVMVRILAHLGLPTRGCERQNTRPSFTARSAQSRRSGVTIFIRPC